MSLAVSVLVPTYGRTRVLGECVESFLRQEFDGRLEMLILNDHPEQHLTLDSATFADSRRITVINAPTRYPDLGTKRNALAGMASHALVAFWDDDDLYLPNAIERMTERYRARQPLRRSGRESHCWQIQSPNNPDGIGGRVRIGNDLDLIIRDSGTLWAMVIERHAIQEVGGFPPYDRMEDVNLLQKLIRRRWVAAESNTPGIPSCIHRLAGVPYTHSIDFDTWKSAEDNAAASLFHETATRALMVRGEEPQGTIDIKPAWNYDYVALTQAAWTATNRHRTCPRDGEPPSP